MSIVMKKLFFSTALSILFISPFLFSQNVRAELIYPVEINYKPVQVTISQIKIINEKEQLVLKGLIKRRAYNSHVTPGHIAYSIFDGEGKLIKEGVAQYSNSLSSRRWKYGSHFSFVLPNDLPEGSRIKLGWSKNQTKKFISAKTDLN